MRWLSRLTCPPGGTVLDPFCGSGSTGIAAVLEGMQFVGCEIEPDHHRIAEARISHAVAHPQAWASTAPGGAQEPDEPSDEPLEQVET
jgi:site-specific DNA-methyltransferase (adenine-specific)